MKRINSLDDLLIEELADLLSVENQLRESLPTMEQASQAPSLKEALENQLKITKEQVKRLQEIFSNTGQNPQRVICKPMKGLIEECKHLINHNDEGPSRDTAIINIAQGIERYVIDGYKTARGHAADLGHTKIVESLDATLNEERDMNLLLNELAQGIINVQAISPQTEGKGFYVAEGKFERVKKNSPPGSPHPRFAKGNES